MSDARPPPSPGCGSHESAGDGTASAVKEQDKFLPIANISRIMKKALPPTGKIAKETMQECISEFISFVTSECQKEQRKTINGDVLLWAMAALGFDDYLDPLKLYLQKFREVDSKGILKAGVQPGFDNEDVGHQNSYAKITNYMHPQS